MRKYLCCKKCTRLFTNIKYFENDFEHDEKDVFNCEICKRKDFPQNLLLVEIITDDVKKNKN